MRLPTANPARGVQSLGRESPYGPLRVANAEARAAEYEGIALKAMGALAHQVRDIALARQKQQAVLQYNTGLANAQAGLDGLVGRLGSTPYLNVNETPGLDSLDWRKEETVRTPEGTTTTQARQIVPTDEVAVDLFVQQSEALYEATRANITDPRALAKFDVEWTRAHQKALLKVTTKSMEQRKDRTAVELEARIDTFIQQGMYENAYAAHAQGTVTGVWSPERATALRRRVDERIAERAAVVALNGANTEDQLDAFKQTVLATPQMAPGDQLKFLNAAETKTNKLRTEYERRNREFADSVVAGALEKHLTDGLSWDEVQEMVGDLRRRGEGAKATQLLKNYDTVRQRFIEERTESDVDTLRELQVMVSQVAFPPDGTTVAEQAALTRKALIDALSEDGISPEDYRSLDQSLRGTAQLNYNREAYRATKRAIWVDVAGMEEREFIIAMRLAGQDRQMQLQLSARQRAAMRAEENLRAYIEGTGSDADIEGWWARNRQLYNVVQMQTDARAAFISQYPQYSPADADPASPAGLQEMQRLIMSDESISHRERQRRFANLNGGEPVQ